MHVDEGVDPCSAKLVDQDFDLIEVGIIVLAGNALNSLPHDTQTDEVESPVLHILDVLSVQGIIRRPWPSHCGDVRGNLVDCIDSMEDHSSASLIDEHPD